MEIFKICLFFLSLWLVEGLRDPKNLEYLEKKTLEPTLDELKDVIEKALSRNFAEVSVEITDRVDLTKEPFVLASSGISGDPIIIEYGNDNNLIPLVDKTKLYDIIPMIREIKGFETKSFFAAGAGAGPFELINQNCEGIFNMKVFQNGTIVNENHIARTKGSAVEVTRVPNNETRAALLGNIFLTEGKPGKVLKVSAKNRTGAENFISSMRIGLTEKYSEGSPVALGGVFVVKVGTVHVHVMDDFSKTPINTDADLNNWLTFHDFPAPIIALGNFVSHETDFKLRLQHFHAYSDENKGGHYHHDTTAEIVEYEGYFNVVERIILIDKNSGFTLVASFALIVLSFAITKLFY